MRLLKGTCSPVYKEIDYSLRGVIFGLRYKLLPTRTAKESLTNNLLSMGLTMYEDIKSKLRIMLTTMGTPDICSFNTYVKLNTSLEDTILSMHRSGVSSLFPFVSYIAVIVDFNLKGLKNSSASVEEMAMFFTTSNYYAQYTVQYFTDDTEMPRDSRYYILNEDLVTKLNQLNLDSFHNEIIINGQVDRNGFGFLTFPFTPLSPEPKCGPDLLVQPKPFCPRIKLNKEEFKIDLSNKKVSFLEYEASPGNPTPDITFSNILSSGQNGSFYACSDEYFSQLPSVDAVVGSRYNELVILTIVCLVLSIISLVFTFIIYCVLPRLRTVPGLNNMALIFHLFLTHTLALTISVTRIKLPWLCSTVGFLLHFNLLSSFFWMFISTFHMMNAFVKIKEKSVSQDTMKKFCYHIIFTESLSAILVISFIVVTITTDQDSEGFGYGGSNCYIQGPNMILYFVAIPLGIVIMANLCMFSYVVWSVSRIPDMAHNSSHERHNLLIFAKLSTLTGITWLFGFLYQFTNVLLFAYFYIVFNAGQGVFIMISFVNKRTLDMLRSKVYTNTNGNVESSTQSTKLTTVSRKFEIK
jgi:hypothetical protein